MSLDPTWQINDAPAYSLGVSELSRARRSLAEDRVTITLAGRNADAAALFAYGATVTITRGGVPWFVGRVTQTPATGSGSAQSQTCTLSGPWWYLDHLTYRQQWTFKTSTPTSAAASIYARPANQ